MLEEVHFLYSAVVFDKLVFKSHELLLLLLLMRGKRLIARKCFGDVADTIVIQDADLHLREEWHLIHFKHTGYLSDLMATVP